VSGADEERTLAPFGRRLARLEGVEELGAYRLLRARDRDGPPDPRPGQFYMLAAAQGWGAAGGRPYLPRAFSHCRAPGDGTLEFLLEDVGPGTARLAALGAGEDLWLTGPLGVGFTLPSEDRHAVLVGGGIGVAPLVCLQDRIGPGAEVLLGFRSAAHAQAMRLFTGEPELATDDGSAGRRAIVTELLREALDRSPAADVYACGPPPMLEAVRALCAEREVAAQLALESGMACGYGACFGCVVPTRAGYVRLCVDGPVLPASELESVLVGEAGH
jgi:NAD(P)H-flavin reductase